jgi:outer membrane protein assembly factor BamB
LKAVARKSYPAASRKLDSLQPRRTRQEQLIQETRQQRSELLQQITRLRNQAGATAELADNERAMDAWEASYDRQQEDRADLEDQCAEARAALGSLDRWDVACPCDQSLILAGGVLVAGGDGQVTAFAADSGRSLWTGRVQGAAMGLAAADGRLFVSTDQGSIHCFGPPGSIDRGRTGEGDSPIFVGPCFARCPKSGPSPAMPSDAAPASKTRALVQRAAETILRQSGVRRGYCLILGCETGELAVELARRSEMMICAVSPDREKVEMARKRIDSSGLYGGRISVEAWPLDRVPYADYFANLVVSETAVLGGPLPPAPAEMFRMIKPVGGVALIGRPAVLLTLRVRPNEENLTRSVRSTDDLSRWLSQSKLEGRMVHDDGDWVKIVRGPLAGSGSWTQLYGNAGNTACGDDRRVRWPLGVLWFAAPGPESTVDRHRRSVAPLSIDGRLFCQGEDLLAAYDAYNGLMLWQRHIEGAMRTDVSRDCGNLAVDHQALLAAVGGHCLKLDPATGQTLATYDLAPAPKSSGRLWGYVGLSGDRLIGTRTIAGGTSRYLFAIELPSGKQLWSYAGTRISHPSISIGEGTVFFVDDNGDGGAGVPPAHAAGTAAPQNPRTEPLAPKEVRRGMQPAPPQSDVRLAIALDARSGEVRWRRPLDLADCRGGAIGTMYGDGVLTIFSVCTDGHYWQQYFQGELASRRVTALAGKDGKPLWSRAAGYQVRPLIVGDKLIAEPLAFDLHTGKPCTRTNPITGAEEPWQFSRPGHHCGCSVASPDCLFFRSYCLGCYDLAGDFGTVHLGGQRPGCWINFIPANGLLLMPEASAGCTCPFPNRASVAFEPRPRTQGFGCYSASGPATPVRRLAVALGAAGDRNDAAGQLWLGYPRPAGSLILPLDLGIRFCRGGRFLTGNSLYHPVAGTADPWRFASAAEGLISCSIPLLEPGDGAAIYRVRLSMAEPADARPGQRLFDIRLQGRRVLADCDVVRRAHGPHRALVEEFSGIEVADKLHLELVPKASGRLAPGQMPILQGVEVIRQRVVRLGWSLPSFQVDNAHRSQSGQVQLSNLRDEAFRGRLEVVAPAGFEALPEQAAVELARGQRKRIEIALRALPAASPGPHKVAVRLRRPEGSLELDATTTVEHLGRHGRLVIPACEDAFVLRRYPDLNKGKATVLIVDGGEDAIGDLDHALAYLKFRVDVPGRPVGVRLRLANAGNPTQDSGRVCRVRQPWSEERITYANRPAPGEELGRIGRVGEYQVVECPLKLDLAGVKELSLVIDPTSVDGVDYFSREGGKPPALVIEYQQ